MSNASATEPVSLPTRRHIEHDMLLGALPHPILVIGEDRRVIYANTATEACSSGCFVPGKLPIIH